ncbi:Stp1/IreP family PP2C-type Ser/Thr phosphatase [uncultured Desulfobacter sp.]|uniref:Stp1/IreP family PP2C-type Ser/Thr phosphatase n=1 Tax=uncultured Desulfobacter sp. TaxID=240139 RepID=UPI0029F59EA7|nr:Stp1/IreP family PP2C-type Ser/Thr phosphatase [uncultured Desulfobacter sp.]
MANYIFVGKTDQGLKRKNNEDAVLVNEHNGFCLVADGIGGAMGGDVASRIFADTAQDVFAKADSLNESTYTTIQRVFLNANEYILNYAGNHPDCEGMGCTAELFAIEDGRYVLGHIGDSRTYRMRNNELKQLTKDHSLVQEQLDQGLIKPEDVSTHALKNVILRAVGIKKNPAVDIIRGNLFSGDIFLLCSDGLTDLVDQEILKQYILSPLPFEQKAEALIQEANNRGGKDNISVVLVQIR